MEGTLSTNPREGAKAFLSPALGNTCHSYYFAARKFRISRRSYFVNNHWFMEFFDRYFHIPLPIVTKHELFLPFPPRNLRIKFGANPSTIFLVIVVTDDTERQTHKPTPMKTYSLAFAEINNAAGEGFLHYTQLTTHCWSNYVCPF